jgi:peroxiredoxin Q/BCP
MQTWKIAIGIAACALVVALVTIFVIGRNARAGEPLKAGDAAPDVALKLDDGTTLQLSSAKKPVVLYFYPKDDTPGCTTEACTFRDRSDEILKTGALVVGVSFDDAESHKRFRQKHQLGFKLASDDGSVATAYGVTVRGIGSLKFAARDTFVISPDMKIIAAMRGVSPAESVDDVLKALKGGGAPAAPEAKPATATATPAK